MGRSFDSPLGGYGETHMGRIVRRWAVVIMAWAIIAAVAEWRLDRLPPRQHVEPLLGLVVLPGLLALPLFGGGMDGAPFRSGAVYLCIVVGVSALTWAGVSGLLLLGVRRVSRALQTKHEARAP